MKLHNLFNKVRRPSRQVLPRAIFETKEGVRALCDTAEATIKDRAAAQACKPLRAGTKKTIEMRKGTFVAPRSNGPVNLFVQSFFCRHGNPNVRYEIAQYFGFFSTDTFVEATLNEVKGFTATAKLRAKIVPSKLYPDTWDLSEGTLTDQTGKTVQVKITACYF